MYHVLQYQGCFVMSNNTNHPTAWGIVKGIPQQPLVGSFLGNGLGNVVKFSCVSIYEAM